MTYQEEKRLLHGGDYNPDQWLAYPDILAQDMALMQASKVNTVSVGIFAWSALEPREGEFHFDWLDKIFDDVDKMGWRRPRTSPRRRPRAAPPRSPPRPSAPP